MKSEHLHSLFLLIFALCLRPHIAAAQGNGQFAVVAPQTAGAPMPPDLRDIGIQQQLGASIPLDLDFQNEAGHTVPLRSFFGSRPVLLVPVYYTCPMLCSQILRGVVSGLRPLNLVPGRDFEVVAFSFNPGETAAEANAARERYTHMYASDGGTDGWHFLTGPETSIHSLTESIGFHYHYDPAARMFLHASGVMVLTPQGRLARYFYGVEYEPKDLRLGLLEASQRRITSPVDQILLFCYHYDPTTGRYGTTVMNLLRGGAVLMLLVLAFGLAWMWRGDLRRYRPLARGEHV